MTATRLRKSVVYFPQQVPACLNTASDRCLAFSPFCRFAPWLVRVSQAQGANKPGDESTRKHTSQGAIQPGTGGESAMGREPGGEKLSQGANERGCEQAKERTGKGAKKP